MGLAYILTGAVFFFAPDIINDSYYGYSVPILGLIKFKTFLGFTLPFEVVVGMKALSIILIGMGIYTWWAGTRKQKMLIASRKKNSKKKSKQ
jgi:hypothetical protein